MEQWTADSPEYLQVTEFVQRHKYLRAVDTLEALVVQRLFELTKMNHSGTGERNMLCPCYITHLCHLPRQHISFARR